MKKAVLILLAAVLLCLAGCSPYIQKPVQNSPSEETREIEETKDTSTDGTEESSEEETYRELSEEEIDRIFVDYSTLDIPDIGYTLEYSFKTKVFTMEGEIEEVERSDEYEYNHDYSVDFSCNSYLTREKEYGLRENSFELFEYGTPLSWFEVLFDVFPLNNKDHYEHLLEKCEETGKDLTKGVYPYLYWAAKFISDPVFDSSYRFFDGIFFSDDSLPTIRCYEYDDYYLVTGEKQYELEETLDSFESEETGILAFFEEHNITLYEGFKLEFRFKFTKSLLLCEMEAKQTGSTSVGDAGDHIQLTLQYNPEPISLLDFYLMSLKRSYPILVSSLGIDWDTIHSQKTDVEKVKHILENADLMSNVIETGDGKDISARWFNFILDKNSSERVYLDSKGYFESEIHNAKATYFYLYQENRDQHYQELLYKDSLLTANQNGVKSSKSVDSINSYEDPYEDLRDDLHALNIYNDFLNEQIPYDEFYSIMAEELEDEEFNDTKYQCYEIVVNDQTYYWLGWANRWDWNYIIDTEGNLVSFVYALNKDLDIIFYRDTLVGYSVNDLK